MKPFFVYSHLGASIGKWEEFLCSHRRIMSNYDASLKKTYMNGNLEEKTPNSKKWFFSKAKWFDIILYNHQIGYKNFYSMYPSILIYSFQKDVLKNIKSQKLYNKKYVDIYLGMRMERLNYICMMANKPLVFVEGMSSTELMKKYLCDYLCLPDEFNNMPEFKVDNLCDQKNMAFLQNLHKQGKVTLAI